MRYAAAVVALTLLWAVALSGAAQGKGKERDEGFDHSAYARVLKKHVEDGWVDYRGLKKDMGDLRLYIAQLSRADVGDLNREEKMALYINAYNAFTLNLITEYYPEIDSIKDIPDGFFKKRRWKDERWQIGGREYSLHQIEHEILRPKFKDARVHFALVCAAQGCPDLPGEPFTGEKLDEQLDVAGRRYLSRSKGMRLVRRRNDIYLSEIFKWFEEDFEEDAGSVLRFVAKFAPKKDAKFIRRHADDLDVKWVDYDWKLNDAKDRPRDKDAE